LIGKEQRKLAVWGNFALDGWRCDSHLKKRMQQKIAGEVGRMQEIKDLERRITAALERIGRSVAQAETGPSTTPSRDLGARAVPDDLQAALEEERMANAQLQERMRSLREREQTERQRFEDEMDTLKAAYEAASGELHASVDRLTKEITALQAERRAEAEEITDIVTTLTPLIEEARHA
jgi:flagellar motility protein MotE (MotC chaperone)